MASKTTGKLKLWIAEMTDKISDTINTYLPENFTKIDSEFSTFKDDLNTHMADNVTDSDGAHGLKIEEGTWTPVLVAITGTSGTHTYSEQSGSYIKIGKLVYVTCGLTLSSKDAAMVGGYTGIRGLPFPVAVGGTATISKAAYVKLPPNGIHLVSTIQGTEFAINVFFDNGATGGLPDSAWSNTSSVRISGVYKTA